MGRVRGASFQVYVAYQGLVLFLWLLGINLNEDFFFFLKPGYISGFLLH